MLSHSCLQRESQGGEEPLETGTGRIRHIWYSPRQNYKCSTFNLIIMIIHVMSKSDNYYDQHLCIGVLDTCHGGKVEEDREM